MDATTVDEYLANVPEAQRAELQTIRNLVKKLVPDAEESIAYGIPTFKLKKKPLIHFAAFKDHLSVFPTADPLTPELAQQLARYRTGKGTLQFTLNDPIPEPLLTELIQTRAATIQDD